MKKCTQLFALFFAVMAFSCGETADKVPYILTGAGSNGGAVNFSGYVYDVTTGAKITSGYTITAETGDSVITGDISTRAATLGKFDLPGIPLTSDYIITVTMTGYKTFVSSHNMESTQSTQTYGSVDALRKVGLVPLTVSHPAISADLVDQQTGASLSTVSGLYRLDRGSSAIADLDLGTSGSLGTTDDGIDSWINDSVPVMGTVSNGSLTIAAGTLDYGYNYTLTVYNCTGYLTGSATISAFTYTLGSFSNYYTVALAADAHYTSLRLLGVNIGVWSDTATANGIIDANEIVDWLPLNSSREIIFYFNQDIDVSSTWNIESHGAVTYYKDPGDFLSLDGNNIENVNNNGTTQSMNDRRLYSNAGFSSVTMGNFIFNLTNYPTNPVTSTATVTLVASQSELVANWQILAPANHVAAVAPRTPTAGASNYVIVNNTPQTGATGLTAGSGNGANVICIPNAATAFIANYDWIGQGGCWARIMSIGADDSGGSGYSNINTNDGSLSITWLNNVNFTVNRQIYPAPAQYNYAAPNSHRTVSTNPAISSIVASGNQLIITLNTDDTVILRDGSYDPDDDLGYNLRNSSMDGLGLVLVRASNPASNSPWLQLYGNFAANGVTMISTIRNTVGK